LIKFEGHKKLQENMNRLIDVVHKDLEPAVLEAAEIVRAEAARRAPRSDDPSSDGHMADNIIARVRDTGIIRKGGVDVGIGPSKKHWYGLFAEIGTRFFAATPWLRPALDENEKKVTQTIGQRIRQRFVQVIRK
jgi:HK97 gp10 family phage protein